MRQVHVCIICCENFPDDVRVTHKIGRSLREARIRVTWVGPKRERTGDGYGIDFRYYPRSRGKFGRLLHYRRAHDLAKNVDNVDVWYGQGPDSAWVAARLAAEYGGKAVFSVMEIYHDEMLHRWVPRFLLPITRWLVRRKLMSIASHCDLLEAVGITRLEPYDPGITPAIIVRNCSPRDFAAGEQAKPFKEGRKVIVLMHGKGTLDRGTKQAVEALPHISNRLDVKPRLVILGADRMGVDGFTRDMLLQYASDLGVADCLDVRDTIPYRKVFELLKDCDVGLILYTRVFGIRCMPNRVFEYMALGLPVIAPSYAVEMKPIVGPEKCGLLVDTEDPKQVADAVCYLAENPVEAKEMGRRGHEAFLRQYNWETEVKPFIDWIQASAGELHRDQTE